VLYIRQDRRYLSTEEPISTPTITNGTLPAYHYPGKPGSIEEGIMSLEKIGSDMIANTQSVLEYLPGACQHCMLRRQHGRADQQTG
jgi:hypothetical protein